MENYTASLGLTEKLKKLPLLAKWDFEILKKKKKKKDQKMRIFRKK